MTAPKQETMDVEPVAQPPANTPETNASSMDTTEDEKNFMASSGTVGSVTCSLHPLVIMNVSEHWTRTRAQQSEQHGI